MRWRSISLVAAFAVLASVFAWFDQVKLAAAEAPLVCTEASTPLQCYNAGLSQMGAAREQMQRTEENLKAKITELEAQIAGIDRVSRIAAPRGSVLAFALAACPDEWSKYEPAIGRFIRGIDPDGNRRLGSLEDDAFQGHTFGDGDKLLRYSQTHTTNDPTNGYSQMQSTGIFGPNGANPAFGNTIDAPIVSNGKDGPPRVADETRPKNVGLLYCKKD
jgi:hypothetical protein